MTPTGTNRIAVLALLSSLGSDGPDHTVRAWELLANSGAEVPRDPRLILTVAMHALETTREPMSKPAMLYRCDEPGDHEAHVLKEDDRFIYQCLGEDVVLDDAPGG